MEARKSRNNIFHGYMCKIQSRILRNILLGFHPKPRLRNFLEKSFLRIFKNFEKGDNLRRLFNFTARAYPYRRDYKDKIRVGAGGLTKSEISFGTPTCRYRIRG